jgi:hypothetical protein
MSLTMSRILRLMTTAIGLSLGAPGFLLADDPVDAKKPGELCDAKAAFEKLKSLAGDWTATIEEMPPAKFTYKVTANGSTVMETLFAGTEHEMVTMYHLDGDDLRLTHYCHAKNQPHLVLDRAKSKANDLYFAFEGGTNFNPATDEHMHEGRMIFHGPKEVEGHWTGYAQGKPVGTHKFVLTR